MDEKIIEIIKKSAVRSLENWNYDNRSNCNSGQIVEAIVLASFRAKEGKLEKEHYEIGKKEIDLESGFNQLSRLVYIAYRLTFNPEEVTPDQFNSLKVWDVADHERSFINYYEKLKMGWEELSLESGYNKNARVTYLAARIFGSFHWYSDRRELETIGNGILRSRYQEFINEGPASYKNVFTNDWRFRDVAKELNVEFAKEVKSKREGHYIKEMSGVGEDVQKYLSALGNKELSELVTVWIRESRYFEDFNTANLIASIRDSGYYFARNYHDVKLKFSADYEKQLELYGLASVVENNGYSSYACYPLGIQQSDHEEAAVKLLVARNKLIEWLIEAYNKEISEMENQEFIESQNIREGEEDGTETKNSKGNENRFLR